MPRQKTVWIKKNADKLVKLYPTHTQKKIAQILNVSLRAVKAQITVLGINKRKRGWTKSDDKYLLTHYPDIAKKDLAAHFGKTRGAIINRYNKLKGK